MVNILVVEDEPSVALLIRKGLTEKGYMISLAPDGLTGLDMARTHHFDLVILDIMMPGISGLELCGKLRSEGNTTPILMLTALGSTENIVTGLDKGADDYLAKPFKFAELEARIRALLRRYQPEDTGDKAILSVEDLVMDTDAKTVSRSGKPVQLTSTEFRLLEYFIRNQRRVLNRMDILENVWGIDFNMTTNVVDVYINYLRKKIDQDPDSKLLHTVVGMGYVLKPSAS
ncbi:response regulator transcription factor [Flavihumibacter petaseus]|uniref:Putative two-component response regulator n=1 Tax=Flavihumibacter petaseus NBRC 106054 TaxID=1220578 RepID=A0A0E9MUJ5_9BACT|nr:response regulator transcription factor [Flavihumibacter petaseus]GAO41158.1 putative two-component response regulator [Flavihumibacter petaseus NBRC 106054]